MERPVNVGVNLFQCLNEMLQTIVVSRVDRREIIEIFLNIWIWSVCPNSLPVQTPITSPSAILYIEYNSKKLIGYLFVFTCIFDTVMKSKSHYPVLSNFRSSSFGIIHILHHIPVWMYGLKSLWGELLITLRKTGRQRSIMNIILPAGFWLLLSWFHPQSRLLLGFRGYTWCPALDLGQESCHVSSKHTAHT